MTTYIVLYINTERYRESPIPAVAGARVGHPHSTEGEARKEMENVILSERKRGRHVFGKLFREIS